MADKPAAFSKIVTTDTSSTSLVVGGADGAATSGTGGVKAGPITASSVASAGLVSAGTTLAAGTSATVGTSLEVGTTLKVGTAIALDGATPATHGIKIPAATPSVTTSALYSPDGAALYYNGSSLATGSSVSGTAGTVCKFTAPSTIGDSLITEAGTTLTALAGMKVQSGRTPGVWIGADVNALTLTNATQKYGLIGVPHYTNATNPVFLIGADSGATTNVVRIGGGLTGLVAATSIDLVTAATASVDTGTVRWTVNASGNFVPTGAVTLGETGTRLTNAYFTESTHNGLTLGGNISAAAWTTSGIGLKTIARTLTDTSSSGTVAAAYTNLLGGNTIAASSVTTFTDYYSLYVADAAAGANVTLTNKYSLGTAGNVKFGGTASAVGTITSGVWNAGAVTSTGALTSSLSTAASAIVVNTNKFTVEGSTGNTVVAGTFQVGSSAAGNAYLSVTPASKSFKFAYSGPPGSNVDWITFDGTTPLLTVTSALSATGDFKVNTDKFTVASSTGNTVVAGTLGVTGDFSVNSTKFTANASTGAVGVGGVLTVSGFGTHTFSAGGTGANEVAVRNTTAGTGNYSRIALGTNTGAGEGYWNAFSSSFSSSGTNYADGVTFGAASAGGISIAATHASGDIRGYAGGTTQKFAIKASDGHTYTDNGSVYSLSDLRFKTKVGDFTRGLADLIGLYPAIYQHNPDTGMPVAAGPFVSLGAQDVEPWIPEAVSIGADGKYGLSSGVLVYALINATRELHGEWQQHDAELSALRARVETLEARLN